MNAERRQPSSPDLDYEDGYLPMTNNIEREILHYLLADERERRCRPRA